MEDVGVISPAKRSPIHQWNRAKKLIQKSGQHLKDVDKFCRIHGIKYLYYKQEESHKPVVCMLMDSQSPLLLPVASEFTA